MSCVRLEVARPEHFPAMEEFLFSEFYATEALNRGASQDPTLWKKHPGYVDGLRKHLAEGLSWVALDDSDNLVGMCVNYAVHRNEQLYDCSTMDPGIEAVLYAIDELEKGHNLFELFKVDTIFDLCYLGVKVTHQGQGLARKLVSRSVQHALENGFRVLESIATHPATIKIFRTMDFTGLAKIKPQTFVRDNGEPFFPFALPEDEAEYFIKLL